MGHAVMNGGWDSRHPRHLRRDTVDLARLHPVPITHQQCTSRPNHGLETFCDDGVIDLASTTSALSRWPGCRVTSRPSWPTYSPFGIERSSYVTPWWSCQLDSSATSAPSRWAPLITPLTAGANTLVVVFGNAGTFGGGERGLNTLLVLRAEGGSPYNSALSTAAQAGQWFTALSHASPSPSPT